MLRHAIHASPGTPPAVEAAGASDVVAETSGDPTTSLAPSPDFTDDGSCAVGAFDDSSGCNTNVLQATDNARAALEDLAPVSVDLDAFATMTVPEQLFVITDIERVDRGLTPVVGLTTQLDGVAQQGANADTDPTLSSPTLTGGGTVVSWGSIYAAGTTNPLGSDYYWMYDDGVGGVNADCPSAGASGCWGHRDTILGTFASASTCPGSASGQYMGAGYTADGSSYGPSFSEILVGACGATPTDLAFTWTQALAVLDDTPQAPPAPVDLTVSRAHGALMLAWGAPPSNGGAPITGYRVLRGRSSTTESAYATVTCTSASCGYRDSAVRAGATYFYSVAAVNSVGVGPASNVASARAR